MPFRERRTNKTHASVTDPDAKLFRKSRAAATKLYFSGNAVAENRCGLIVDFSVDDILTGERAAALRQVTRRKHRRIKPQAGIGAIAQAKADRAGFRLVEGRGRFAQEPVLRTSAYRALCAHRNECLQPRPHGQTASDGHVARRSLAG